MAGGGNRSEADQLLDASEKLLATKDFQGAKTCAIRACKSDPSRTHAADYILAISDTLLAGESTVTNSESPDWYAILRLSHLTQNPELIAIQYRRLSLLLDPKVNRLPFADEALKLVSDAWSFLSDPHKKSAYDLEFHNGSEKFQSPLQNQDEMSENLVDTRFWTACPYCFVLFEYLKCYEECTLRCQNCKRAFEAVKTRTPPVKSDGEESVYFCSWSVFPLGFLGNAKPSGWSPISQLSVCPAQRLDQEGHGKAPTGNDYDGMCVVISDDDDDDDDMYVVISDDDDDDD